MMHSKLTETNNRHYYGSLVTYVVKRLHVSQSCELCNSYTIGCPPVRGLSYVQVGKHGITISYHLHLCRPCAHHEIFHAKVVKGGINVRKRLQ